ncbi:MAG: hypothetical protein EOO88_62715 [Pedobacter sp.]|nr:MAG: hypothetical protein EOO88_62715 [Pedobacter sp.]
MQTVLPMKSAKEIKKWERIDDVIMGGQSNSKLEAFTSGAAWSGDLVLEGGGFCGTRIKVKKPLISTHTLNPWLSHPHLPLLPPRAA